MTKSNRKVSSIRQQAVGTVVVSVAFLGLAGWLWTVKMDAARIGASIRWIWGPTGVFFAVKTHLRAHRSNRPGWVGGDETQ